MSEGINPLEHAHYKSEELEKARQLLDDAEGKLDEAAKIFCSIMHDKDECYEECPALNKEGWVICYIYDSFEDVDMMLEKIDFLMKSSREKEGENNAR
ncbi:hypothetical protein [Mitsuokella multacida]|uniref:hypothetical protein n=1 Tax=Mitsuokella multacida TaxID=52226 RepID=UPI0039F55E68